MQVNGDKDPLVLFGGLSDNLVQRKGEFQEGFISADKTFAFFANNAGYAAAIKTETLPHLHKDDTTTAEKRVRSGCAGNTTSTEYVFHGAGHAWPGLQMPSMLFSRMGESADDVDAGTAIWAHFKQTLKKITSDRIQPKSATALRLPA